VTGEKTHRRKCIVDHGDPGRQEMAGFGPSRFDEIDVQGKFEGGGVSK